MRLKYAMDDGYLTMWYFVDRYISRLILLIWRVCKEQQVTAIKRWFHGTAANISVKLSVKLGSKLHSPQHYNNGRFSVGQKPETFPHHESRCKHRGEIQYLKKHLLKAIQHLQHTNIQRGKRTWRKPSRLNALNSSPNMFSQWIEGGGGRVQV